MLIFHFEDRYYTWILLVSKDTTIFFRGILWRKKCISNKKSNNLYLNHKPTYNRWWGSTINCTRSESNLELNPSVGKNSSFVVITKQSGSGHSSPGYLVNMSSVLDYRSHFICRHIRELFHTVNCPIPVLVRVPFCLTVTLS